jgi:hypothetical protein
MYELRCNGRIAGRFATKAGAQAEETRLGHLAQKRGDGIVTRIVYVPDTEQEANEDAYRDRVGSM